MELPFIVQYEDIPFLLTLIALLLFLFWNLRLEWKLHRFLIGSKATNLNETLSHIRGKIDEYEDFREELETYLVAVENRLRQSIQGVGMIRFNPFRGSGSGGNQSFASAFINEHGNGLVISTLYSREHISIFAKPIKKFSSEFELTTEEKDAIKEARQELK